ncbi:MAG: flagellar basal-body rod protein FlgF [Pseudomonadota bacterium]
MSQGAYIPLSSALVQEKRLEVLANNLANVNTVGFKGDRPTFKVTSDDSPESSQRDSLMRSIATNPLSLSLSQLNRLMVTFGGTRTDFSPGMIKETGNQLDLALQGEGFFSIKSPQGIMYTRNGSFTLGPQGKLLTQEGLPVLGENGEITIDGSDISITADGTILVGGSEVGKLRIVDFQRPYPLNKIGSSLFSLSTGPNKEVAAKDVKVKQGFLEMSNVNIVKEMVLMIDVHRAYEAYQKVIEAVFDTTTYKTVNEVGRLM